MATTTVEAPEQDLLVATFQLGDGVFGIDTSLIQEVVMVGELTPVRHAPEYVAGIRNLRGRIITVIDLGVRLGLAAVELAAQSRILIIDWKGEPVGLLVDQVEDAIPIGEGDLKPAPPNVNGVQKQNLQGVFQSCERLASLLDIAVVLGAEDASAKPLFYPEKGA